MRKLKCTLVFVAVAFLGISNVNAQRADAVPIIKYAVNNYATISKACDTCLAYAGKPLVKGRPIPLPEVAAFDALTGLDPKYIPGIIAPNFVGGGSPEIKGLVKAVAGMKDYTAEYNKLRTDKLYFRTGAQGVAVTSSGRLVTASGTILPGDRFDDQNLLRGFFSFKSTPLRLPFFNTTSDQVFDQSSKQFIDADGDEHTYNMEVIHFVVDPKNENIVYASLRNPEATSAKVLARKNPDTGKWEILDWDVPGELDGQVWGTLAMDNDNHLYVADPVRHIIVKIGFDDEGKVASRQIIGGQPDTPGFVNDEDGRDARFNKPSGICLDAAGNIYIGDAGNNRVRKIDADNGDVTTYAGSGEKGFEDDQDWAKAKFWEPTAVAYNNKTKALYVVDFGNKLIREIQTITDQDREVSTLAGNAGSLDPREPARLAMTVYYVLAQLNMDPDEAKLDDPTGIAIDPSGYGLYVSDDHYIKYVNTYKAVFEVTGSYRSPDSKIPIVGPILPPGIFMNPNNGTFFGIPATTWEPTTYTIKVTNSVDRSFINGVVTFEVIDCPDVPVTHTDTITISPKQLPYSWNGQSLTSAGTASVTLKTSAGCDSVAVLNLIVRPEFTYNCDPYMLSLGLAMTPIVPGTSGATLDSFSVSPPLPAGLTLDTKTGTISGTPTTYATSLSSVATGPKTPPQYAAPWTLEAQQGADITQVQISDCNQKVFFENNSRFGSLAGSAGQGTGWAGAYTDFSGLGPIKMSTNTPYSIKLSNALKSSDPYAWWSLNEYWIRYDYYFMNSYAVYIDYNRDGDFEEANERVYISAGPQTDAHAEIVNLNIPATATPGVTKMRIYCVEAMVNPTYYFFKDWQTKLRTTDQALSFYPFYNNISNTTDSSGRINFHLNRLDYGEFEDYNLEIESPSSQAYVIKGSNKTDSAQAVVKLSINDPSRSTTNLTVCSSQLPYNWNGLAFFQNGPRTGTAKLVNRFGADSLATLNLTVIQSTRSPQLFLEHCGSYNFNGQIIYESGYYRADITNVAGCDSTVYLKFRQKATASLTDSTVIPSGLPFTWNGIVINTAGIYAKTLPNSENCDSIARLNLRVQYNIYYPASNTLEINKPITAIRPQIERNYTPPGGGYFISPALPGGLYLDEITGVISGTPTQLSPLRTYTITLQRDGAQPATFSLSVGMPTVSTTTIDNCGPLTWNNVVYDKAGTFIAPLKNQYGFDSTATLVLTMRNLSASTTDLFLNYSQLPFAWNGDSIRKEGLDTVHFVNSVGCDSAAIANVVVSPKINYLSPQILQPARVITPIAPQNLGGKPTNYTITPSLVRGLQFNAATGVISGTPADTLLHPVTHTIHATNGAGSDTTKLVIAVCNTMATSFTLSECDSYIWNDSTYTASTTHTRTFKNRGGCDSTSTMNLTIRKSSKGLTETVTACGSHTWYGVKYDTTGIYPKVFTNAVGCDSTIYLNLTINPITTTNLYVNLNASDLPYTWKEKTFNEPGRDSIMSLNSFGCNGPTWMTVRISDVLPDISYAVTDTVLYWEKSITTPIRMTNTGTAIPAMKLGETDTLIKFSTGGPGDHLRNIVKGPDGVYYATIAYQTKIHKLDSSGKWAEFVDLGSQIAGMAIDRSGNLYANTSLYVKKITPGKVVSNVAGLPMFGSGDALAIDADNNLIIADGNIDKLLTITKYNLSTESQVGQMKLDHSPYFDYGEIDMETDSKGNIYISPILGHGILKIKPNGEIVGIGRLWSNYYEFKPGNRTDAMIPDISSMAIDSTNDNVYLMAYGKILRVDTAENVTQITETWFDQWKDHIFRVDGGKLSILNNTSRALYTANVHGVGSLPFMDNFGGDAFPYLGPKTDYKNLDRRIRLDSSGAIVGTPRGRYNIYDGNVYGWNTATNYTIIGANHHGVSRAPMTITVKNITYKREHVVTTSLPFVWRGRSFTAATDTATHFVANRNWVRESPADDTMYMLHLVYEGPPEPVITSTCVQGGVSLAATGAAKSSISFDGTNFGIIKNLQTGGGVLGYYSGNSYRRADSTWAYNFSTSFEVWVKPTTVSGTQYIITRDTVKTHSTFFGLSVQDGKLVYEFTKGRALPYTDYTLRSNSSIEANVWTHVAASYYDSAMYIFINGKLEGKLQTPEGSFFGQNNDSASNRRTSSDLFLAGLGTKYGFKGEMDEFRASDRRRNADSVLATMNTIVDPMRGGLGLYYRFDEGVGEGAMDISKSNRRVRFIKPATSVDTSGAPIYFASYKWAPGDSSTKSIIVNPAINTVYTVTVKDYRGTMGSASLLVYPSQGPSITAPAAVARTNTPTSCGVVVSDADLGSAIATDNCPGLVVNRTGVPAGNLFPLGVTTITYTAINMSGRTKSATQTVTITDNSKPAFTTSLSADLAAIWPPDHKLKAVNLSYGTADNCGTVKNIITVTSTDPITGVSDGDKSPDWIVTNDRLVQLRAERGNGKEARVYTITVTPVDSSGNVGTAQSINVYIAHNITAPVTGTSFKIGSTVAFSGVFWDKGGNKHTGQWVIDDNTVVKGIVTEPSGTRNGKVTGSYKFTTAGTYKLKMNITDQNGVTSYCNTNEDMEAIVVVYDPAGGYTYGGGWFTSPAGALKSDATATGKVNFGYAVNYFKGAANPKGETQFELKVGNLEYNALNFEYLSIAGARAQIKGTGKITGGQSGINFIMTVIDGALDGTGVDKVRIKIYNKNTGQVFYDNETGSEAANPVTRVGTNSQVVIGGGNITTGSTAAVITEAAPTRQIEVPAHTKLQAKAFPNPSHGPFTIAVQGGNNEPVSVRVTDVLGRLVEVRRGMSGNGTFTLGASYRPGLYIAEVLQEKEKVVLKLVKQSE